MTTCLRWSYERGVNYNVNSKSTCLRVFLTFRLSFKVACFMEDIFSGTVYFKHTGWGLMQSVLKIHVSTQIIPMAMVIKFEVGL
jgi:hypothetical protein